MKTRDELFKLVDESRAEMIELQRMLTGIPALAPENAGEGESKKAAALIDWLAERGVGNISVFDAPDPRVPSGKRPNVVVELPGRDASRAFWVMSHLDVVPPGELSQWTSDPFTLKVEGDRLYGRGVEDNQQGLASSVAALLALLRSGYIPPVSVKLLFAADEEVGSKFGIQYLLSNHRLFSKNDLFLVPDGGNPEGTMIEVAEKGILWLKFSVTGKQVHASMPQLGVNAFLAGSDLVLRLAGGLKRRFPGEDRLFSPPCSTFSPTKKEANVPNVNTIPGLDVFCLDSRVLPRYRLSEVLAETDLIMAGVEKEHGVGIIRETLQQHESPPTAADCALVNSVRAAVKRVYGVDAAAMGVGGGTVGAYLRNAGYDTVIWTKLADTCHMPNEYCLLDNLIGDAKVMLELMAGFSE